MKCRICGRGAKLGAMGYVHANGGMYLQYCTKCGWEGEREGSYQYCMKCGSSNDLRDDHIVSLDRSATI